MLSECEEKLQGILEELDDVLDQAACMDLNQLEQSPVVIEMDAIESTEAKALLAQLVLNRMLVIIRYMRSHELKIQNDSLDHVIILDGLDLLFGDQDQQLSGGRAYQQISLMRLLMETEATGSTGVIGLTAAPADISRQMLQSFHSKIMLPSSEEDLPLIEYCTGKEPADDFPLADQAMLFTQEDRPVIFTPDLPEDNRRAVLSDEDVSARVWYWVDKNPQLMRYPECADCPACIGACDFMLRDTADRFAARLYYRDSRNIHTESDLREYFQKLSSLPSAETDSLSVWDRFRLYNCTKIRLYKEYYTKKALLLKRSEIVSQRLPLSLLTAADETFSAEHLPIGYDNRRNHELVYFDFRKSALFYVKTERGASRIAVSRKIQILIGLLSRVQDAEVFLIAQSGSVPDLDRLPDTVRTLFGKEIDQSLKEIIREASSPADELAAMLFEMKKQEQKKERYIFVMVPDITGKECDSYLSALLREPEKALHLSAGTHLVFCVSGAASDYKKTIPETCCLDCNPDDVFSTRELREMKGKPDMYITAEDGEKIPLTLPDPSI